MCKCEENLIDTILDRASAEKLGDDLLRRRRHRGPKMSSSRRRRIRSTDITRAATADDEKHTLLRSWHFEFARARAAFQKALFSRPQNASHTLIFSHLLSVFLSLIRHKAVFM